MRNNKILMLYEGMITVLFSLWNVVRIILNAKGRGIVLNNINIGVTFLILILGFIFNIINNNNIFQFIYMFLIFGAMVFWKNYSIVVILALVIAFINVPFFDIVNIYKVNLIVQIICCFLLSVINFLPITNIQTGIVTFGFSNENVLGMNLTILSLLFLLEKDNSNKLIISNKKRKYIFILIITFFDSLVLNDFTASGMVVIFFIIYLLIKLIKNKYIIAIISFIIPIIISLFVMWLGFNFSPTSDFMVKLNNLITLRPSIWNYYFRTYPIQAMPSHWIIQNNIFRGAFDGAYAYLLVIDGYRFLIILVLGLAICNYRLAHKGEWYLLTLMLAFEFASFSENTLISYNQDFAAIFAILSFNISWMRDNLKYPIEIKKKELKEYGKN